MKSCLIQFNYIAWHRQIASSNPIPIKVGSTFYSLCTAASSFNDNFLRRLTIELNYFCLFYCHFFDIFSFAKVWCEKLFISSGYSALERARINTFEDVWMGEWIHSSWNGNNRKAETLKFEHKHREVGTAAKSLAFSITDLPCAVLQPLQPKPIQKNRGCSYVGWSGAGGAAATCPPLHSLSNIFKCVVMCPLCYTIAIAIPTG